MSIEILKNEIKDYAKDTRLNLSVLTSAQGITQNQAYGIALASAYTTKSQIVIDNILGEVADKISVNEIEAAKSASTIMAMNNVYYRAIHFAGDEDLAKMPAGLRMQVIANSGIERVDFELYALAVSAINGCGACVESHVKAAYEHGVTRQGVQSTLKIAAVINAAAQGVFIG